MEDLVVDLLVVTDRDFEFDRGAKLNSPAPSSFCRVHLTHLEGEEHLAVATLIRWIQYGALSKGGVPDGWLPEMVIDDDAFIQDRLGDADRRPEAD